MHVRIPSDSWNSDGNPTYCNENQFCQYNGDDKGQCIDDFWVCTQNSPTSHGTAGDLCQMMWMTPPGKGAVSMSAGTWTCDDAKSMIVAALEIGSVKAVTQEVATAFLAGALEPSLS